MIAGWPHPNHERFKTGSNAHFQLISKIKNTLFFAGFELFNWDFVQDQLIHCLFILIKQPATGHRNKKVDGSHLRTKSHVDLGVARGAQFYDTSMKSDFKAVSAPYNKAPGITTNSSIPLDYYSK